MNEWAKIVTQPIGLTGLGVQGDVTITVDQSNGKTTNKKVVKKPAEKPKQASQ